MLIVWCFFWSCSECWENWTSGNPEALKRPSAGPKLEEWTIEPWIQNRRMGQLLSTIFQSKYWTVSSVLFRWVGWVEKEGDSRYLLNPMMRYCDYEIRTRPIILVHINSPNNLFTVINETTKACFGLTKRVLNKIFCKLDFLCKQRLFWFLDFKLNNKLRHDLVWQRDCWTRLRTTSIIKYCKWALSVKLRPPP